METERILKEYAIKQNAIKSAKHKTSNQISPSKLAYPTQTALLQLLGVPTDPINDKVLRIFERGNQIERYMVRAYQQRYPQSELQVESRYRNAIGYADIWADTIIECKSVNPKKFNTIKNTRRPQTSHAIQACYYALANGQKSARLSYVSSDNLQAVDFTIYAEYWQAELDYRISTIYQCLLARCLPDFYALEAWHKSPWYTPYKMFHNVKGEQAEELLEIHHPSAYKKLKKGELIKLCDQQSKDLITSQINANVF